MYTDEVESHLGNFKHIFPFVVRLGNYNIKFSFVMAVQ